jgi:hypothetical protein
MIDRECAHGVPTQVCPTCKTSSDVGGEIARLRVQRDALQAAVEEALEYFEDREDVRDGSYGEPMPNTEMTMAQSMRAALAKAKP